MISCIECTLHPKIFNGKMYGRSLTEPIRFKVTSGIKVSRVKKKLGSIFEVSACGMDVAVVRKHNVVRLCTYEISSILPLICWIYVNCCHALVLNCFSGTRDVLWMLELDVGVFM